MAPAGSRGADAAIVVATRRWETMTDSSTFGDELRRLRRQAGLSLPVLAGRIHYSKGYLSKVETGAVRPNTSLATLCDVELRTGGVLAAMLGNGSGRRRGRRVDKLVPRSALPTAATHFTGRAREVEEILAALRGAAGAPIVCVVSGPAGVGKTTLAVRCAHRMESFFTDGVLFLNLRGHRVTATEALAEFLRVLGVPGAAIPSHVDDRAAMFRSRLRGRNVLIVLDNAGGADQVRLLLPAESRCRVLITSRLPLSTLDGTRHVPVGALPEPDAMELFTSVAPGEHSAGMVRMVVGRSGYVPLTIRIAAALLRANPAWRLADLDQRLAVEASQLGGLDGGEPGVAAVLRLAVADLPAESRTLLCLLSLHPGADLDPPAAAALGGLELPEAERLLGLLCAAHLIARLPTGRYQFHDLLATFTRSLASADVDETRRDAALDRLLRTYRYTADSADRTLAPHRFRRELELDRPAWARELTDRAAALSWFRAEWPNLVALCELAAERGEHDHCWQLAFSLRTFLLSHQAADPLLHSQKLALRAAEAAGAAWAQAVTLNHLGVALADRGELDAAAGYHRRALATFRELGDEYGTTSVLADQAWVNHCQGAHREALQDLIIALDFYRKSSMARKVAATLRRVALVETALGAYSDAIEHAGQSLSTSDDAGLELAEAQNCLGWAHFNDRRLAEAEAWYRKALASAEECGSAHEVARAVTGLGNVAAADRRAVEAGRYWSQATRLLIPLNPLLVGEMRARLALSPSSRARRAERPAGS
jgi:tetratricopeptide (TPR) repeat protein